MTEWLTDANGNRASIEYFGTREAAQAALDSLKNCRDCTNCSRCSGCSGCSRCSGCSDCSRCSRCSDCSGCSGCSGCSRCSRCSDCSDCSGCSGCSGCSDCSRCSDCSDCSGCSRCSRIAFLYDKNNVVAERGAALGAPIIPTIPNIHRTIYEAASAPKALAMETWHTCEKTHCRAGWTVTLAGQEGRDLERFYNTELAAMMIYDASDPAYKINPARFYDANEAALADMKALAKREAKATQYRGAVE